MKILHTDSDDIENPLRGGQPVRTFQINSRLTSAHEVKVFTATYPGSIRCQKRDNIHYCRLGLTIPGWGLSSHLSFLACLPYAMKKNQHDVVIEEFAPPFGFCMLPLWTDKPVISMVQWFFFRDWERRYKLPFEKIMRKIGCRTAYRYFIVQSDCMGDYFRELFPKAKIWKVPCGITDDAFHTSTDDGSYALFLGRLDVHHKGLDFLVETWIKLKSAGVRIPLKIVGAGSGESWLRQQICTHHLDDLVEMIGRVEGPAKEEWLKGCRFLVMPSRQETFGLTALEAMAASRPVLTFDIAHLNEVVRPAWGKLAHLGDIETMACMAAHLWQNPLEAKGLGERGHHEAKAFRWDAIAQQQLAIYHEVLGKGSTL